MKPKTPDPRVDEGTRNRKQLAHPRQIAMKRGIETGDLRQRGKCVTKCFNQCDFSRQMAAIERLRALKLGDDLWCNQLVFEKMQTTMNDAMTNCGYRFCCRCARGYIVRLTQRRFDACSLESPGGPGCRCPYAWQSIERQGRRSVQPGRREFAWQSPDVNTANLTLDDPALTTKIKGGVGEVEVEFDGRVMFCKTIAIARGFTVRSPRESADLRACLVGATGCWSSHRPG